MSNPRKSTRFASRAFLLLSMMAIPGLAQAELRTLGTSTLPNMATFGDTITELDPGISVSQSFFATGTGTISEVNFMTNGGDFDVAIHEGRGKNGRQLQKKTLFCMNAKACAVKFTPPIPVKGGQAYSVVITNREPDMRGVMSTRGDIYKEGSKIVHRSGYANSNIDLYLQVTADLTGNFGAEARMNVSTPDPEINTLTLKVGESIGQSFVATGTGTFETMQLSAPGIFDFDLYLGAGNTGRKVYSQRIEFIRSIATFETPIPVEAGKQYTFVLTNRGRLPVQIGQTKGNGYPYGAWVVNVDPLGVENDIYFNLLGWANRLVQLPPPPPAPTYDPYRAAGGPLTLINCESSPITVGTFNENDNAMLIPFKSYRLARGQSSQLQCRTSNCKLKIGNIKTGPLSGYHVMVRGQGRPTHPEAIAAGCALYDKYK